MSSIYHDILLDHYKHPRNFGNLKKPDKKMNVSNPVCGDKIKIMIRIKNSKVEDIKFSGQGCVISTASASLLTEHSKNKKTSSLKKLDKDFILKMLNIHIGPVRLKCALLPLEALKKILNK